MSNCNVADYYLPLLTCRVCANSKKIFYFFFLNLLKIIYLKFEKYILFLYLEYI